MLKLKCLYYDNIFFVVAILITFSSILRCQPNEKSHEPRFISAHIQNHFMQMFKQCLHSSMASKQFAMDDLKKFINFPSRTTVGASNRLTNNRKFFANLVTTIEFKEMLQKDMDELTKKLIMKMKFCDEVVMDQELLRDLYDREVDPTKMKK